MPVIDLTKITDAYISSLPTKWKAAKTKHDAALKAKKITFNKSLGSKLDKRLAWYKSIRKYKAGDSLLLVKAQLNSMKSNGKEIKTVAEAYQAKIKGMGDPAEKELRSILNTIISDAGKYDMDYVDGKLNK